MSLPSSERLPNDINDLPPARQRHIRRQPRSASLAERQILLDSLFKLTAPTPAFFLKAFLGALAVGGAIYLNDPTILIVALVILPFHTPLFGLALFPTTLKFKHLLHAFVSLLILLVLTSGTGAVAGLFHVIPTPDRLNIYRFSGLYWLDLAILGISVLVSSLILLRQGQVPRGMGVLLAYTLLIPIAVAGFGLTSGQPQLWSGALFVSFIHLGIALVLAMLAFLILGFPPSKTLGWMLVIVTLMVTFALISASLNFSVHQAGQSPPLSPSATVQAISSNTPEADASEKPTLTEIIISEGFTPSWTPSTPTNTPPPTQTATPEPTPFWGIVASTTGAVIRENPSFDSLVVAYANDGDLIEILDQETASDNSRWLQVRTEAGSTGWMLGSLVNTQTPTPTPQD